MDQEREYDFFEAVKAGDEEQVEHLLDLNPWLLNAQSSTGVSASLLAIYYGHPDIVNLFDSKGKKFDIFEASAAGKTERVKEIIRKKPDLVNAYAQDGFQPLGLASFFGHTDIVKYLLSMGADVNSASKNENQVMPLHSAVARQNLEITRILLQHGADVNAVQADDFTPLHAAVQNGQVEMVLLLLDYGANPGIGAANRLNAIDMARQRNDVVIENILLQKANNR
ncbi:MAG: ankyrin repeat domain-containing protein [Omnitrophica WOR_2 bacterium]